MFGFVRESKYKELEKVYNLSVEMIVTERHEVDRLKRKVNRLIDDKIELQKKVSLNPLVNDAYKANEPDIPKSLIKRLLMLCHPDKHGGKDLAIKVTQELNKLRGK